jgi:hypothetical protein
MWVNQTCTDSSLKRIVDSSLEMLSIIPKNSERLAVGKVKATIAKLDSTSDTDESSTVEIVKALTQLCQVG